MMQENTETDRVKRENPQKGFQLFKPLAIPDFRLLWIGQGISVTGDQFYFIALSWLVLELTDSGTALGSILLAGGIPRVVFMLFGGALSDRIAPKYIMIYSNFLRLILVVILAFMVIAKTIAIWHIYILVMLFGIVDAFFYPAYMALIPTLAGKDKLEPANALMGATGQLTLVIGSGIAGFVIKLVGTGLAFVIDALTFIVSLVTLSLMKITGIRESGFEVPNAQTSQKNNRSSMYSEIVEGLKYTWKKPLLRAMMILSAAINFSLAGPIIVGFPKLIKSRLESEADLLGILFASWGAAAFVAALLAGSFPVKRRRGLLLLISVVIYGICFFSIGFSYNAYLVCSLAAIIGFTAGYMNVIQLSWIQSMIEPKLLGRVMSFLMLAGIGMAPVSHALTGKLVDYSITFTYACAGSLVFIAVIVSGLTSNLRSAD